MKFVKKQAREDTYIRIVFSKDRQPPKGMEGQMAKGPFSQRSRKSKGKER